MADFIGEDLSGSRFERVNLTGSRFERVNLSGAEFRASDIVDTSFRGVDLNRVVMRGVALSTGSMPSGTCTPWKRATRSGLAPHSGRWTFQVP